MNPIDSYKNSCKSSLNFDNNLSQNNFSNFNENSNIKTGIFENFPLATRLSSKDNLRVLENRNINPFNLENKALASADLFQNNHSINKKIEISNNSNNVISPQENFINNKDNRFSNIQSITNTNVREYSNQRLQNFSPIPTSKGLPINKNIQYDNKISYPVQTRNMEYNSLNSELEKKNSERTNFI